MANFKSPTPHLFVHRGGNAAGTKRENTLPAFQSAARLGYTFIETDVIVTKDNQVITYHGSANFIMKLIFGLEIRRKVQRLTYEQIRTDVNLGGESVPKLKDVLSKFKNQCFCVDVKTDEAVRPLVRTIKELKAEKRVIITSFSKRRSIKANRLLYGEDFSDACFCVYRLKGYLINIFPHLTLSRLKKKGFGYIHIPYRCISKRLLKEAKKQDIKVYAWTVNKKEEIKELLSLGIDGIISDEAELLIKSAK